MAIRFMEYAPEHAPAVTAFNQRIASDVDDPDLLFSLHPTKMWLPKGTVADIFQETFLAVDGDFVRGGYVLKHQPFAVKGEIRRVSSYRLPLSEGIVNRAFVSVGLLTLRHALAQQALLFSLGMGSLERPVVKMQKAAGWTQFEIPFYFKILNGERFLRNIAALRRTAGRRAAADVAALTGLGSLVFAGLRRVMGSRAPRDVSAELVPAFGPWTDELWAGCFQKYGLIAVRDQRLANLLYPAVDERFLRFRVSVAGRVAGWVVCLNTQMHGHKQFGDMRVATIVDCLAAPEDAGLVLGAVTREMERQGPDMIISNQMNTAWAQALQSAGYLAGPTNFIFSASKKLAEAMGDVTSGHMNRGDGDGPVHL